MTPGFKPRANGINRNVYRIELAYHNKLVIFPIIPLMGARRVPRPQPVGCGQCGFPHTRLSTQSDHPALSGKSKTALPWSSGCNLATRFRSLRGHCVSSHLISSGTIVQLEFPTGKLPVSPDVVVLTRTAVRYAAILADAAEAGAAVSEVLWAPGIGGLPVGREQPQPPWSQQPQPWQGCPHSNFHTKAHT